MSDVSPNFDSWSGGTFDALMFFGPTSLNRTADIANWMWTYDRLDGPYRERYIPISQQPKVSPNFTDDGCEQLVGQYRHQDGLRSPFVHTTIRGDDGLWIYAGIPMGGFPANWDVGAYPFEDGKPVDWMLTLIDDLRLITSHVRRRFSILAASYGWFDVSILDTIDDALKGKIADDRWHPIELKTDAGIKYYPITKLESLFRNTG
jgi:hypothetical protein